MRSHRLHDVRHRRLAHLAASQGGVVSRRDVYDLGITRWEVQAHVRAGRWQRLSDQAIALHTGPVLADGMHWAAVFQGGPRAHLDGASALVASGLQRFEVDRIRVSVPRGAQVRRTRHFDVRQTRRWDAGLVAPTGVPRTLPATAAVRGALWAASDRQATLLLTMTVQQGLATADQLSVEALRIRRDRRRSLVHAVVIELAGGATSLGEIDLARECRRRRIPEPTRQTVVRLRGHRYRLDVVWEEWGVVVEVDGIQHAWAENVVADALRHNAVTLHHLRVLRLPLLGLRAAPDEFFGQIREALVAAGCPLAA